MIPSGGMDAQFSFQEAVAHVKSSFHLQYGHRVYKEQIILICYGYASHKRR